MDTMDTTNFTTEDTSSKIIKIKSNDEQVFEIDQDVVEQSSTIKTLSDGKFITLYFVLSF